MTITEREWRRAQEAGAAKRRAGRPMSEIPEFGSGNAARMLREAAEEAWREEDRQRRKVPA